MTELVTVKSTGQALEFWLQERGSYAVLRQALHDKLSANAAFYAGIRQPVVFFGKHFSAAQKRELKNLLHMDFGMDDVQFVDDETEIDYNRPAFVSAPAPVTETEPEVQVRAARSFDADSVILSGTVRSGQRIESAGDVTVLGDVNPGAEIVARGSVLVFGKLRGLVHAGAAGDKQAVIVANHLMSSQIRLASKIAVLPAKRVIEGTEVARIEDDKIIIETIG